MSKSLRAFPVPLDKLLAGHCRMTARHVMRATCAISSDDRQHMRHALELAKRGLGKTHPNPAVGCVILKDGKVSLYNSASVKDEPSIANDPCS